METWQTKPTLKKARQWKQGDEFPGVNKEVVGHVGRRLQYRYFVITTNKNKAYLEDGDYVVQELDGNGYYPCKAVIWEANHTKVQLSES